MLEWIKFFDIFGKKVEIKVDGNDYYKSYSGALISFAYGIIMLILSVLSIQSYLRTDSPGLIGESYERSLYPEINLENNNLMPFFIGYRTETDLILPSEMSKFFTFTIEKIVWRTIVQTNESATLEKVIDYVEAVPCGSLSEESRKSYKYIREGSFLQTLFSDYAMCMPGDSNLRVFGKGSDQEFGLISFKVKPCSLPSGCASIQEMRDVNFQWVLPTNTFDSSNYVSPKSVLADADNVYYINPSINQIYVAKFKEIVVWDSEGFFNPDPTEKIRYFDISDIFITQAYRNQSKLSCTVAETLNDSSYCDSYFEFSYQSSGNVFNYKRAYKTLGDSLGEIGGLNGIVILIFTILAKPIMDWVYDEHIFSSVYCFLRDDTGKEIFGVGRERGGSCLKKWRDGKRMREMKEHGLDMINENVDIVSIIKDINTIKVLAGIFLKERHTRLAEIVQFKMMLDRLKKQAVKKTCGIECGKKNEKKEEGSIKKSLEDLKRGIGSDSPKKGSPGLNQLVQQISDTYYKDVLLTEGETNINFKIDHLLPLEMNVTSLLKENDNKSGRIELEMIRLDSVERYSAELDGIEENDGSSQPLKIPKFPNQHWRENNLKRSWGEKNTL